MNLLERFLGAKGPDPYRAFVDALAIQLPSPSPWDHNLATRWATRTKPLGSLGRLESLVQQLGVIQQTDWPELQQPTVVVFAADHGIAVNHRVSAYPQEVTAQMVQNFLNGGAAISVLARRHNLAMRVVDVGVANAYTPPRSTQVKLVRQPIAAGTANSLMGPAMSVEECFQALQAGMEQANELANSGCTLAIAGEMGIGNTTAASAVVHVLSRISLDYCVGIGSGLDEDGLQEKRAVVQQALDRHKRVLDPLPVLQHLGGFELAALTGFYLQAAQRGLAVLLDGYIATAALLVAVKVAPAVRAYVLPAHASAEQGHKKLLNYLSLKPLLKLDMRLGEASGAALAYGLVQQALALYQDMAGFDQAGVSTAK